MDYSSGEIIFFADAAAGPGPSLPAPDPLADCRGDKRVPMFIIANLAGVSRLTLHRARDSGRVSAETCEVLTPIVRDFEAGRLKFRRTGPRDHFPKHWEVVET